ncbi:CheR family methyltransferase [Virgibacillus sp. W0181]|uniref:CheR family methyltransferase n=1 Tax=Virgibacillus sp. W0181 TaxID=3391581 RepID=UPI003F48A1F6
MADNYNEFISSIKGKLGIDLNLYKETQMKRRLISLRNKRGFHTFAEYFKAIDMDQHLLNEFIDRITINVSEFYRNPKRWEVLRNTVLPILSENKNKLNIWSAACSTGEEPYSLAIMAREHFPHLNTNILATDIDDKVLDKARQGVYQERDMKELPHKLQKKYFVEENGLFYIDASLRAMIQFKKHDLLADPHPEAIDLLVCRNVLIYFTDEAKEKIYYHFSKSLAPQGVLFVGSTEQIFSPQKYGITLLDTFFYQKTNKQ